MTTRRRAGGEEATTPSFIPVSDDEHGPFGTGDGDVSPSRYTNRTTRSSSNSSRQKRPNRARVNTSPVANSPLAPATRFNPSAPNPNANWQNKKGTWLTNLVIIWTIRLMFAVIPGISKELSWTLTNCAYGLVKLDIVFLEAA